MTAIAYVKGSQVDMSGQLSSIEKKLDTLLNLPIVPQLSLPRLIKREPQMSTVIQPNPLLVCSVCSYPAVSDNDLDVHITHEHQHLFYNGPSTSTGTRASTSAGKRPMPKSEKYLPSAAK